MNIESNNSLTRRDVTNLANKEGKSLSMSFEELVGILEELDIQQLNDEQKEQLENLTKKIPAKDFKLVQIVGTQHIGNTKQININPAALGTILELLGKMLKDRDDSAELLKSLLKEILDFVD